MPRAGSWLTRSSAPAWPCAKKEGVPAAMPVEKSGQDEFEFEYGADFGAHIEEFDERGRAGHRRRASNDPFMA